MPTCREAKPVLGRNCMILYIKKGSNSDLDKTLYPASDRNLEIWLAETNTICSDIMLPN